MSNRCGGRFNNMATQVEQLTKERDELRRLLLEARGWMTTPPPLMPPALPFIEAIDAALSEQTEGAE
jgi:hypothetical protein